MRATTVVSFLVPFAAALWDPTLCGGVGGCSVITWAPGAAYDPSDTFTCPSGATVTVQRFAQMNQQLTSGNYENTTEFPSSCYSGSTPTSTDQLVKATDGAFVFYAFIAQSCPDAAGTFTEGDCYNANPNPAIVDTCRITEGGVENFCLL